MNVLLIDCVMQLTHFTTTNGYPLHICQVNHHFVLVFYWFISLSYLKLAIILLGQKIGKSRIAISSEAYAEIVDFLFGNFRSKDSCIQNAAVSIN